MRMYASLLNNIQEHKHCECRSRKLCATSWLAWALGLRSAPPSSRHPQEDGLEDAGGPVSRRGLLRCPWHLFPGPGHTFLLTSGSRLGAAAAVAAAGLSSLLWGGQVADDDLEREGGWNERLGMTWLIALARFWASANLSIIESMASPKRPEGVIGVFNSTLRSASLRSAKVSHRCLCWTTMNPMVRPIAWAARFVAISAKSVAARRSFTASGEAGPAFQGL